MNDLASRLTIWPGVAADGSDAVSGLGRRARHSPWEDAGAELKPGTRAVTTERWFDSDWFKEWEALAYARLGQA